MSLSKYTLNPDYSDGVIARTDHFPINAGTRRIVEGLRHRFGKCIYDVYVVRERYVRVKRPLKHPDGVRAQLPTSVHPKTFQKEPKPLQIPVFL
jgi:hypothetical protein